MDKLKEAIPLETYETLVNANIRTVSTILAHSKTELAQITKLDIESIEKIIRECANIVLKDKICTANCLNEWQHISTGCDVIDDVAKGGVSLNGITEIVGCSGVGKTQICLQLAIMTQLPRSLGGLEKSVVYICTEDVFPVKRFKELSQIFSRKYKYQANRSYEDNVFIEHVADIEQLKLCLFSRLKKLLSVKSIGLIIIDSIAGVFRSENVDVNYTNRSHDFISIVVKLNKLSEKYGFAVICVNQVADNITTGSTEPCLGLAWSSLITCRFNINRFIKSQERELEVIFAPNLPNRKCKFIIGSEGLIGIP